MATNFPGSLDAYARPAAGDPLDTPSHAGVHDNAYDAVEAVEAKVGVDSSAVVASMDYFMRTGWVSYTAVTPTHDDATQADDPSYEITFAGVDLTAVLYAGMKLKLTQGTVKYFIITKVTLDGSDTDVVLYGGTDYDLVDTDTTAISVLCYSTTKGPVAFPMDPDKWTVETDNTGDVSQNTTGGVWYNLGTITINIPIGVWNVDYQLCLDASTGAGGGISTGFCTLSKANNSEDDDDWTGFFRETWDFADQATTRGGTNVYRTKILNLTIKDTYYLNAKSDQALTVRFMGATGGNTIIRAICAYL